LGRYTPAGLPAEDVLFFFFVLFFYFFLFFYIFLFMPFFVIFVFHYSEQQIAPA